MAHATQQQMRLTPEARPTKLSNGVENEAHTHIAKEGPRGKEGPTKDGTRTKNGTRTKKRARAKTGEEAKDGVVNGAATINGVLAKGGSRIAKNARQTLPGNRGIENLRGVQ